MNRKAVISLLPIALAAGITACSGASVGKHRAWDGSDPSLTSCAASCISWDSEGKSCQKFHQNSAQRCAYLLGEEIRDD